MGDLVHPENTYGLIGEEMAGLSGDPPINSKLYHLRRFHYDTATVANPIQMQALKGLVGSSQILFGTDFPFVPVEAGLSGLQTAGFNPEEIRAICFDNAMRILPGVHGV
jgi:predicted TIM-barrel fold metal-dependent hydrolase